MNIDANKIKKLYIGYTLVDKLYCGKDLIYFYSSSSGSSGTLSSSGGYIPAYEPVSYTPREEDIIFRFAPQGRTYYRVIEDTDDPPISPWSIYTENFPIVVPLGYKLQLSVDINAISSGSPYLSSISPATATYDISGDIRSLKGSLGYTGNHFTGKNVVDASGLLLDEDYTYAEKGETQSIYNGLFSECAFLKYSPLHIPVTNAVPFAFDSMFYSCISLQTAPSIAVVSADIGSFANMFNGCASLQTAPDILVTNASDFAFRGMFEGCTDLLTPPPTLAVTTGAPALYQDMFKGCASLQTAPSIHLTSSAEYVCSGMFMGCYSLTEAPTLALMDPSNNAFESMFEGCTSIETANVNLTALGGCKRLFYGCSNLSKITVSSNIESWGVTGSTENWVNGVAPRGTFVAHDALTVTRIYNDSHIPPGWEILSNGTSAAIPLTIIPRQDNTQIGFITEQQSTEWIEYRIGSETEWTRATFNPFDYPSGGNQGGGISSFLIATLQKNHSIQLRGWSSGIKLKFSGPVDAYGNVKCTDDPCYELFYECTNLITAPSIIGNFVNCSRMFYGCSDLISISPVIDVSASSYLDSMFQGCTNLTSITLPDKLAGARLWNMFQGCRNLQEVTGTLHICSTKAIDCREMFKGCWSLQKAPELLFEEDIIPQYACFSMFQGCENLVTAPAINASTIESGGCCEMFAHCSSLLNIPAFNVLNAGVSACEGMFLGCTSLQETPVIKALGSTNAFRYMFFGCSSLSKITVEFTSWNDSTSYWVVQVAPKGTFIGPDSLAKVYSDSAIPESWSPDYKPQPEEDTEKKTPFTIEATYDNTYVGFDYNDIRLNYLFYKLNNEAEAPYTKYVLLKQGEKVSFHNKSKVNFVGCSFYCSNPVILSGDIQSLLDYSEYAPQSCFYRLFTQTSVLTTPSFTAKKVSESAYGYMFSHCESLLTTEDILAEQMAENGCSHMFEGCTALTNVPKLPIYPAHSAYDGMFSGCTSIIEAPILIDAPPASMFLRCSNLISAPLIIEGTAYLDNTLMPTFQAATNLARITSIKPISKGLFDDYSHYTNEGVYVISDRANNLFEPTNFPATWAVESNVPCLTFTAEEDVVFSIEITKSKDTTVVQHPIQFSDFAYCVDDTWSYYSSKKTETQTENTSNTQTTTSSNAQTESSGNVLQGEEITLLKGSSLKLFHYGPYLNSKNEFATIKFSRAKSNTGTQESDSPTQAGCVTISGSFRSLFNFKNETTSYCFYKLFNKCTCLKGTVTLDISTITDHCYDSMFLGCSNIKVAYLEGGNTAAGCYDNLFKDCSNLDNIKCSFTSWDISNGDGSDSESFTTEWVSGVATSGIFYADINEEFGPSRIPEGWTALPYACLRITKTATTSEPICIIERSNGATESINNTLKYRTSANPVWKYIKDFAPTSELTKEGDYIEFSNDNNKLNTELACITIKASKNTRITGSLLSLLGFDTTCPEYCFYRLFKGSYIDNISVDFKGLTLAPHCFEEMFADTHVTDTSDIIDTIYLPSTELSEYCYASMFKNSEADIKIELPATDLAYHCYAEMFRQSNITSIPELPSKTLASNCYSYMFYGCKNITECTPFNVTDITAESACYRMFSKCTSLKRVILPWYTADSTSLNYMFEGCTSLSYIETNMLSWGEWNHGFYSWVKDVCQEGTFVKPGILNDINGDDFIPTGWKIEGNSNGRLPLHFINNNSFGKRFQLSETIVKDDAPPIPKPDLYIISDNRASKWDGSERILPKNIPYYIYGYGDFNSKATGRYWSFVSNAECRGDLLSLIGYKEEVPSNCFAYAFSGSEISTLPSIGPVTSLGERALYNTFSHTANLSECTFSIPECTVSEAALASLFEGSSVKNFDENSLLLFNEPADYALYKMFNNCYYLETAPSISMHCQCIPWYAFLSTFENCSSLHTIPTITFSGCNDSDLFLDVYKNNAFNSTFKNCTSLVDAQSLELPYQANYTSMFEGCTKLITPPKMTMHRGYFTAMFKECTSLTTIPKLNLEIIYSEQVETFGGTPDAPAVSTHWIGGCADMFNHCPVLRTGVSNIIGGNLVHISKYGCQNMFKDCHSLEEDIDLSCIRLFEAYSCDSMFSGCRNITKAIVTNDPDIDIETNAFNEMFIYCQNLMEIRVAFTSWDNNITTKWVSNITTPGYFIKPPSLKEEFGSSRIPYTWKALSDPGTYFIEPQTPYNAAADNMFAKFYIGSSESPIEIINTAGDSKEKDRITVDDIKWNMLSDVSIKHPVKVNVDCTFTQALVEQKPVIMHYYWSNEDGNGSYKVDATAPNIIKPSHTGDIHYTIEQYEDDGTICGSSPYYSEIDVTITPSSEPFWMWVKINDTSVSKVIIKKDEQPILTIDVISATFHSDLGIRFISMVEAESQIATFNYCLGPLGMHKLLYIYR